MVADARDSGERWRARFIEVLAGWADVFAVASSQVRSVRVLEDVAVAALAATRVLVTFCVAMDVAAALPATANSVYSPSVLIVVATATLIAVK